MQTFWFILHLIHIFFQTDIFFCTFEMGLINNSPSFLKVIQTFPPSLPRTVQLPVRPVQSRNPLIHRTHLETWNRLIDLKKKKKIISWSKEIHLFSSCHFLFVLDLGPANSVRVMSSWDCCFRTWTTCCAYWNREPCSVAENLKQQCLSFSLWLGLCSKTTLQSESISEWLKTQNKGFEAA